MAIDWNSVLPSDDVNLDHVNADEGNVILADKEDVSDAVPGVWRGSGEPEGNADVKARPAKRENSIIKSDGDVERDRVINYLGWRVERTPLKLVSGEPVKTHVAQVRSDNRDVLGVVTTSFRTIQNDELLQLADAVTNGTSFKFCNAGMCDGGSRVFFQCKGESFDVGDGDEVSPYMLFCNGHDGSLSCRMLPMTKRMQCQNQLGNILKTHASFAVIRHTGDTRHKLDEAKRLGQLYFTTVKANREAMLELRGTAVKTEDLQKFFYGVYEKHFGAVQMNAKTEAQERAVELMKEGFGQYMMRFEKEKSIAGPTAWNMANAYTWWLQHCKGVGKDARKTANRRYESALFGVSATRSVEAFHAALIMAG
jgi:phage/plasmid-like protein (TIGR03299 family)